MTLEDIQDIFLELTDNYKTVITTNIQGYKPSKELPIEYLHHNGYRKLLTSTVNEDSHLSYVLNTARTIENLFKESFDLYKKGFTYYYECSSISIEMNIRGIDDNEIAEIYFQLEIARLRISEMYNCETIVYYFLFDFPRFIYKFIIVY